MSAVKTCPLCGTQRWKSDGTVVIEQHELKEFRLWGLTSQELALAVRFAEERGWKAEEK